MESRNLILAIILSVVVLFIWSFFFEAPEQEMLNGEIGSGDVSEVNSNELDMEAIDEIERSLGIAENDNIGLDEALSCLLYTSPSPRDYAASRMPSSA